MKNISAKMITPSLKTFSTFSAIFLILQFALQTFAAGPDFDLMKAVINSPATEAIVQNNMNQGEWIGVEKSETFRCPGCFEYTLKFKSVVGSGYRVSAVRLAVIVGAKGEVEIAEIKTHP